MNVITQFPAAFDHDRDRRMRTMFEGAAIGIGICHLDGRILEANPALARMFGCSQQEMAGPHAGALCLGGHLRGGDADGFSGERSGDQRSPRQRSLDERSLDELIRGERESVEMERRYRRKDGSELWGHITMSLGRDARSQPAFLIASLSDATERKRVEEHLCEAGKMEVIGRLAGGIAHDFNNLLTGILLYCELLSAGLAKNGMQHAETGQRDDENRDSENQRSESLPNSRAEMTELWRHVEEVRMAGEQGAALTHQLLAIARKEVTKPHPTPINEIVASMENLLERLIGEHFELVLDLDSIRDSGSGFVLADPAQLRQILLNLVLNARDAMPQGGKITLSTRAAEFPKTLFGKVGTAGAGRAVALAVQDNGCGMDGETRARLFEPFFTTKEPGVGTGLGLGTVQRIVTEAGGMINVESEVGRGTLIEVFLPMVEGAANSGL